MVILAMAWRALVSNALRIITPYSHFYHFQLLFILPWLNLIDLFSHIYKDDKKSNSKNGRLKNNTHMVST
jgi:hypothetical protein